MTENILVIGGSGFIGRSLLKKIADEPLDRFTFFQGFFNSTAVFRNSIHINILDPVSVESVVQKFDIIINCSGQITRPIELCYRQNTIGIQLLTRAVKKYNKYLIQLSSTVVYGSADHPDESSPLNFESPYAACKTFAEYIVRNEIEEGKYLTIRIANLYGDDQKKGLFAYLKSSISTNRILHFNNDGNQKKSFIHLDDCISALLTLLKNRSYGTFNLPISNVYTIKDIIRTIEETTGACFYCTFEGSGRLEILNGVNADKFFSQTDYKLKHTIESFIKSSFL
jgi:UDP-glucose 4-epimerase